MTGVQTCALPISLRDLKDDRATLVTNNAGGAYFNVSVGNGSTQGNLIVGNTVATLSTSANVTLVANGSVELNAAVGNTSVTVQVEVYAERIRSQGQYVKVTEAQLTYVAIDDQGRPKPFQETM